MKRSKKTSSNANHPKKGATIKVEPIRDMRAIKRIKKALSDTPRDLCLFTLGINTAYRAGEILSLTVGQIAHLKAGERLDLKQSKTGAYRATTLNGVVVAAVQDWLKHHPNPQANAPLFTSRKGNGALCVAVVNRMVKSWCAEAGLKGNFGSHSLRKTWGFQQRKQRNRPVALLMAAYGHASEKQTLAYLGIEADEIADLYMDLEL